MDIIENVNFEKIASDVLQEYEVKNASQEEHDTAIEAMSAHLEDQDNGKVGIFWYDVRHKALFGVIAVDKDSFEKPNVGGGLISCRELHAKVWAKGFNRQKYKLDGKGPFVGDYKDTPRGRVFYDPSRDLYLIKVGSWIHDHHEAIDEILDEFDLRGLNFEISVDSHWDIGCGWENF